MLKLETSRESIEPRLVTVWLLDGEQLLAERKMNLFDEADIALWTHAARLMANHNEVLQRACPISEERAVLDIATCYFMSAVTALFPTFGQPVEGIAG